MPVECRNRRSYPRKLALRLVGWTLLVAALVPVLAWAEGPRFRPDGWRADEYGRAESYPVGKRGEREQKKFLVGAYSRGDALFKHRSIATSAAPSPLRRAAREPAIRYGSRRSLSSLDDFLEAHPTTGLLIARGDQILVERYQYDRRDTDPFTSQSMAKTIVALLVGIAVSEGHIRSIADTAETYVPALKGSEFGRTPIKALLQMSSGMRFQHGFDEASSIGDLKRLNQGPPGAAGVLQFNERAAPPGTRFNYSAADTRVLGMVLAGATGATVSDYASEKLWKPLGAEAPASWWIDSSGQEMTSCCFAARLRDYARLGLMLAHEGAWNGRQIVPRGWLRAATTIAKDDAHLEPGTSVWGYGYQVWLLARPGRTFAFRGLRGQMILVDPDSKTVMVRTAVEAYNQDSGELRALWRGVLEWVR